MSSMRGHFFIDTLWDTLWGLLLSIMHLRYGVCRIIAIGSGTPLTRKSEGGTISTVACETTLCCGQIIHE